MHKPAREQGRYIQHSLPPLLMRGLVQNILMKKRLIIILLLGFTIPLISFNDFKDFWTVKLNGKLIYDSGKDTKKSLFFYKFAPILTN